MSPAKDLIASSRRNARDKIYSHWNGVLRSNCQKLHRGESVEVTIAGDSHPDAVEEAIAQLESDGWRVVRLVPNDSRLVISVAPWSFWRWLCCALKM